jgi:hypothetical protein
VGYCGDNGFVEKAFKEAKPPAYSVVPAPTPRNEYTWFDPDRMELPSSGMYSAFPEEKITLRA